MRTLAVDLLTLGLVALGVLVIPARRVEAVLCIPKSGTGTVKVRTACKKNEVIFNLLDVSVRVRNSADYSIADSAEIPLTFDTEDYDTDNMHSTTVNTHQLMTSMPGKYYIFGQPAIATPINPGVGSRYLRIRVNGVSVAQVSEAAAPQVATRLEISTHYALASGDVVELSAYADSQGVDSDQC